MMFTISYKIEYLFSF